MNLKKIALTLFAIMLISLGISAILFYATGGYKGRALVTQNNIDEEKTMNMDNINNVYICSPNSDVKFIPEDRTDIKVHFYGYIKSTSKSSAPELYTDVNNGKISIEIKNKDIANFVFSYVNNTKLDVYIPKTYSKNINTETSSADLAISDLSLEQYVGKSSSGNLNISNMNMNKFSYSTSSGDLTMDNISGKNTVLQTTSGYVKVSSLVSDDSSISSSSGDINFEKLNATKAVIRTTSGRVEINDFTGEDFTNKSSSGDLRVSSLKSKSSNITTTSGKIELSKFTGDLRGRSSSGDISVDYSEFANNIDIGTTSGYVKIKLPKEAEFYLSAVATSGDVKCKFPILSQRSPKDNRVEGTVKSDKNKIEVKTSSGDIKIEN